MAAKRTIRRVQPQHKVDFDEQLWPLIMAIVVLAAFVGGWIVASSSFDEQRLIYNGWFRLAVLGVIVAAMLWGVSKLHGRSLRHFLLCVLLSLLGHLWVVMYLNYAGMEIPVLEERQQYAQEAEALPKEFVFQHPLAPEQQPEQRQVFDEPVRLSFPEQVLPDIPLQRELARSEPAESKPPVQPEAESSVQPQVAAMERAPTSAPRRVDLPAGGTITRQPLKDRPEVGEPIPEPQPLLAAQKAQGTFQAAVDPVQQQDTAGGQFERRAVAEPQSTEPLRRADIARHKVQPQPSPQPPATPTPSKLLAAAAEVLRSEAVGVEPVQAARVVQAPPVQPDTPGVARASPGLSISAAPAQPAPLDQVRQSATATRVPPRRQTAEAPAIARFLPQPVPRQPRQADVPVIAEEPVPQLAQAGAGPTEAIGDTAAAVGKRSVVPPLGNPAIASPQATARQPAVVVVDQPRRTERSAGPSRDELAVAPAPVSRQPAVRPSISELVGQSPSLAAPTPAPTTLGLAAAQPGQLAVAKAEAGPAQAVIATSPPGIALPPRSTLPQLPTAAAARAAASQQQPGGLESAPSMVSTPHKAPRGVAMPSAAIPLEADNLQPAAVGSVAGGRIEASSQAAAVERTSSAAPPGPQVAAAGAAEFAFGSSQTPVRLGQPRSSGLGQPAIAAAPPASRVQRATSAVALTTAPLSPDSAQPDLPPGSDSGGPPAAIIDAPSTAAARKGRPALPAPHTAHGPVVAPAGGAATQPSVSGVARAVVPLARADDPTLGGGTPMPARTALGTAAAADVRPEAEEVVTLRPRGAPSAGSPFDAPTISAGRQSAGLAASDASPAPGALASLAVEGQPAPAAIGRRATASQTTSPGSGTAPAVAATVQRHLSGAEIPVALAKAELAPQPGGGGLVGTQGGAASTLEPGSVASVTRTHGGAAVGSSTVPPGSVDFGTGAARVPVHAGRLRAGSDAAPSVAVAAGSPLGRMLPMASAAAGLPASPMEAQVDAVGISPAATGGGGQTALEAAVTTISRGVPAGSGPSEALRTLESQGDVGGTTAGGVGPTRLPRAARGTAADQLVAAALEVGLPRTPTRAVKTVGGDALRSPVALAGADSTGDATPAGATTPSQQPGWSLAPGEAAEGKLATRRQPAGLPGGIQLTAAVEPATVAGPTALTPGSAAGPRRLAQGRDAAVAIAADVGSGPLGKSNVPGLARGLPQADTQLAGATTPQPGRGSDLTIGTSVGEPSRQTGGLPVQIAAVSGPGGLDLHPVPTVGISTRLARPESDVVHPVTSRFLLPRSGTQPVVTGVVSQPTEFYQQRDPRLRPEKARAAGGGGTEKAVEAGLEFFARIQFPDGRWSLHKLPPEVKVDDPALGSIESDTAATGLALLTFLGAGYTHLDDKHRDTVRRGIEWLVRNQKSDGDLFTGGSRYARFYSHGIATIALCEAYGMTQDPELRDPARKAVEFIVRTQHPEYGGWRYDLEPGKPYSAESDTSVTGWQLLALKSAQMAGLEVPAETFQKMEHWLRLAASKQPGRYIYNPHADPNNRAQAAGLRPSLAMTAEAMLMRIYLGAKRDDRNLIAGADWLKANLPTFGREDFLQRDCYYWYYATQAMFQMQGEYWTAWNDQMRRVLEPTQVQQGPLAGSWHPLRPVADRWGQHGGRLYVTALHLLMLEVYYRHLPLFQELAK